MLKVGILGLGLIGGSIAKSLKYFSKEVVIAGFDTNRQNANFALENQLIDCLITEITEENVAATCILFYKNFADSILELQYVSNILYRHRF